ncbi:MAG: DUF3466 family protein [Sedimentisphaerales bacterium]|nr:DUF3466 family protein [Sedimentisphaerales bacterium]
MSKIHIRGKQTLVSFILFLITFLSIHSAEAVTYTFDAFTGLPNSNAYGLNNQDIMVGRGYEGGKDFAFSYDFRDGTFTNLSPSVASISWAHAINDQGLIVGGGVSDKYRAFYWENDSIIDVTPAESWGANAIDINEKGQAVGYSKDLITHKSQPIMWEKDGSYKYLDQAQHSNITAYSINDYGQIAGVCEDSGVGLFWNNEESEPIEIPTPSNWNYLHPLAINNNGDVVGYGRGYGFWGRAFLYSSSNNQFIDLHDTIWKNTFACDINDQGQIIITASDLDDNEHILLWEDGVYADITPEINGVLSISEINELGHIVGSGDLLNMSKTYAFIGVPVSEPLSILLLGFGLIALAGLRRKA